MRSTSRSERRGERPRARRTASPRASPSRERGRRAIRVRTATPMQIRHAMHRWPSGRRARPIARRVRRWRSRGSRSREERAPSRRNRRTGKPANRTYATGNTQQATGNRQCISTTGQPGNRKNETTRTVRDPSISGFRFPVSRFPLHRSRYPACCFPAAIRARGMNRRMKPAESDRRERHCTGCRFPGSPVTTSRFPVSRFHSTGHPRQSTRSPSPSSPAPPSPRRS